MTAEQIKDTIEQLQPGKCTSIRDARYFVVARKDDAGYSVACGWAVQERHNDDYLSYGGPSEFKGGKMCPWVGREFKGLASEDAAAKFSKIGEILHAGRTITNGTVIGSVSR